ncbi:hypothetical protein H2201_008737 [Coniosporium apollinis]|uniref:Uncharacterized protein n=1 Tax=Coniosporium apollinis TaxID=61459 RepID=A0ABQ9NFH2_9PEZI|nr:hypothetical protein H2201_008737 [Coniosporium apollinis]
MSQKQRTHNDPRKTVKENQPILDNTTHKPFKLLSPPPRDSSLLARCPRPRDITPVSPAKTPPESPMKPTPSNIGKRRSYAPALLSSPARPSHSSRMMKIFQDARLSLKTKDLPPPTEYPMRTFDTSPQRRATGRPGYFDATCSSPPDGDPFRSGHVTNQARSNEVTYPHLPPTPHSPYLPDNPWHVAMPSSHLCQPPATSHSHSHNHTHTHTPQPPPHIPNPSNRTSRHDSVIEIIATTPSSPSWSGDDEFYVPSTVPALPAPPQLVLPTTEDPWVNAWLEDVPVGVSPTTELPPNGVHSLAAAKCYSKQEPRRFRFHSTRISEINGEGEEVDGDADAESEGEIGDAVATTAAPRLVIKRHAERGSVEEKEGDDGLAPLSPDVEIKRGRTKERSPGKTRCASYFDEDIVPSPKVRRKKTGRGGVGWF